jgi:CDP-diacylglycerol pyrophosphatase
MAINSDFGRTQDQLHIHIDCVRMGVMSALADHEAEIGPSWAPFPVKLAGERYKARRISGEDLRGADPFKLLAEIPAARADMGAWTLAVIGARFADGSPGFWLLAAQAGVPANPRGASESLLDHDCAVLHDPVG